MGLFRRASRSTSGSAPGPAVPAEVVAALGMQRGERLLAPHATSTRSGPGWLLATTYRLGLASAAEGLVWLRPWHEVDQASWQREARTLAITFVDSSRVQQYPLDDAAHFLQVFRERVQASVVAAVDLSLTGPRKARAVIRADLRTGDLLEQVVLGRGTRPSPEIDAVAAAVLVGLREEVGLPPARG